MIQYARIFGSVLVVTLLTAGVGWGVSVINERARLTLENRSLMQSLQAAETQALEAEKALGLEKVRAQRFLERSQELTGLIEAIVVRGTPDAPLHPDLADVLNGLRPSEAE